MSVGWQEQSGTWQAHDGTTLFYTAWTPPDPQALVLLAHGKWEHQGRYAHVVTRLVGAGFAVAALDHRGHGRSGGQRGHVARFQEYLADFHRLREHAVAALPSGVPLLLLGHSFGGLLVLRYALDRPEGIRAVAASAPALQLAWQPPAWKASLGRLLSRVVPTISLASGLDPALLSRDPAILTARDTDPLVHDRTSARDYTETLGAMTTTLAAASRFALPLLLMHGTEDALIAPEGTQAFYERAPVADKSLMLVPGARHEIFNEIEPDRSRVLDALVGWFQAHL